MTTATPHRPTAYDTMLNYWRTTGKVPPMPTEYSPGALDTWMEVVADIGTLEALRELREERLEGRAKIVGLIKAHAWDLAASLVPPGRG
jgi:hypothetical protein